MAVNHLLVSLIFFLAFKTGLSADISVFVQTGAFVQLDIQTQELPEFDHLFWSNDKSENIVRHNSESKKVKFHSSYKERVDYNEKNFSLTLKNMQKTDSGLYTARISGESDNNIVTYRVYVIEAVEAPVLTVNSGSSSDSCSVNLTCRAHELMINSSYQNNRCSKEEVTSHENYTLILNCSDESIICNHSNPVSWKEDRINITQLCDDKEKNSKNVQIKSSLLEPVVVLVAACIFIICISVFLYHKCKKGPQKELVEGTVYAQVQVETQTQDKPSDKRLETTYCTIGQHQKPTIPPGTEYTIYSMVCKQPNKKPPTISSNDT